jgi:hypothetical protein
METCRWSSFPPYSRDQTRPDMRPEPNPTESNPEGSGSGSGSGSASKSYTSTSGAHPSYPSNPAVRVNTSEKRLTLVDSAHGSDGDGVGDDDDDDDEGLYKTRSRRTDLDSVEAGHYQRGGMGLPGLRYDDEVIDIAKPSEVHRY